MQRGGLLEKGYLQVRQKVPKVTLLITIRKSSGSVLSHKLNHHLSSVPEQVVKRLTDCCMKTNSVYFTLGNTTMERITAHGFF